MIPAIITAQDQGLIVSIIGALGIGAVCFLFGLFIAGMLMPPPARDPMAEPHGDVPHQARWPEHDWDGGVQSGMFAGAEHDVGKIERRAP